MIARRTFRLLVLLILATPAAPLPAAAQAIAPEEPETGEDLKRRLDDAWDRMMQDLGPAIDSLGGLLDTFRRIDGFENYESPEILPNGDIIIRRKPDAPPLAEPPSEPEPKAPRPTLPEGPSIKT